VTVTISGGTGDAGAVGDNRPWKLWAAEYQPDGTGGVITTRNDRESNLLRPVAGSLSFEVEPGIACYLENPDGKRWLVSTPEVDTPLWDVIEASAAFPPDTDQERLDTAVGQYVEANREQFRTHAVPIDPEDPNTLYQWVDENGDPVGDPVESPIYVGNLLGLVQAAKNPDLLVTGAITLDGNDLVASAAVKWPDGSPGTLTITSRDGNSAVLAYNITYGSPVTKTFTQPAITRNTNGAATNVPAIVVS
jgi:hypothetical protein